MPIYEYQCRGCAHEFETIQKISEPVLTTCPSCGKDLLRKKISASAFRLKGAGWYETDFKSGDKRNVAGRDDGGESKSADTAASGDNKSDNKSDSKDAATNKTTSESASSTAGNGGSAKESTKETTKPKQSEKTDTTKPKGKNKPKGGTTE
jgi:putative FmdB family regulatory protein